MRGAGFLAATVVAGLLAGCSSPANGPVVDDGLADQAASILVLKCLGEDGGQPTLESSWFGTCWGHTGHQTYFLDPPVVVTGITGNMQATEVSLTTVQGDPDIRAEASLDGHSWSQLGVIPYPLNRDPSDRYVIPFDMATEPTPVRFLRFSMPPSTHEGLAGYLDKSYANLTVQPMATSPAPLTPAPSGDCSGGVLESFFADHPCWFGGYDQLDEAQGGEPTGVHAATELEGSWFDSPSFLHTYVLGEGLGGTLTATVRAQLWRVQHYAMCSGLDPTQADALPVAIAQASWDGLSWTEVGRATGNDDQPIAVEGIVPDGSRFLRFGIERGASWDQGGCHHPRAFLVESSYSIA